MVILHEHKRFMSAARTTHLPVSASGASIDMIAPARGARDLPTIQTGPIVLEKAMA